MIPADPTEGKAIYIPEGVRVEPYEPKKKRRKCSCGGRGEWYWNGEIICSKCLIDVKLADQKPKVEYFIHLTILTAKGVPERWEQIQATVNTETDPPTLNEKGYRNLASIVVVTHRMSNRARQQ